MKFKKIFPSLALQPFVKNYWILKVEESDIPFSQLLFPFGSFELIINIDNAPEIQIEGDKKASVQSNSLFPGQFTKSFLLNYTKPFKCMGISMQPWTGNSLFKIPANHFTNNLTNLEDIEKKSSLREQLLAAKNEFEIIGIFEDYLLKKLKNYQVDQTSTFIAKAILNSPSIDTYKDIVSTIGISRRRIEQRFLETTGLPMGFFVRKIRFQKAVTNLLDNSSIPLTQIGMDAGYYDQSHFIREFKELSTLTPKEFLIKNSNVQINVSKLMMT